MAALYTPRAHDEALDSSGEPRPLYRELSGFLESTDAVRLEEAVHREVSDKGITFVSEDGDEEVPLDPIPRLIAASEWEQLAAGLGQRARALGAFLADAYGSRRIVEAGAVPEYLIESAELYEPWLRDVQRRPDDPLVVGFDLVRDAGGRFLVLEDNLRTPSGFSYVFEFRQIVNGLYPDDLVPRRLDPGGFAAMLADELERARPPAGPEGIAVLSGGPASSARFEHRALAEALGVPLLEAGDLRRRGDLVIADGADGGEEIGVILRRADEDRLQAPDGEPTELADLFLEPIRAGKLCVVNAFGNGVADDKLAHAYVEEMIRFYLDEDPVLRSVPTFDLTEAKTRATVLERLNEMVIKPRAGAGGEDVIVCAQAHSDELERARRVIRDEPWAWVAQETVVLSTHPTVCDGRLEPRHIDLRAFAVGGEAAPAALTRFATDRGDLVVNSSQGGGCKDTWILDR